MRFTSDQTAEPLVRGLVLDAPWLAASSLHRRRRRAPSDRAHHAAWLRSGCVATKVAIGVALVGFFVPPTAASAATVTVIHPTGSYPEDVGSVQSAVDKGGTVLLKATDLAGEPTAFNFGPSQRGSGWVDLTRDVALIGERVGSAATTIQGGHGPIDGRLPIRTVVRGIAFERPYEYAVLLTASADTEVVGNHISDVVGRAIWTPGGSITVGEAILVEGGRARIAHNVIKDMHAQLATGISQFDGGPVEIVGNYVTGTNTVAIESSRNAGTVTIEDNFVRPGPERSPRASNGTGIEVNGTGAYRIARNRVVVENPNGQGITVFGTDRFRFGPVTAPVITNNNIELRSASGGVSLYGKVSDAYVGQNAMGGRASTALGLFNYPLAPSDLGFNTFVGNNIARLESTHADVLLQEPAHDTVVRGFGGTVIDLGTNNQVTGFTAGGGRGSGEQVAEATKHRNDALHDAHDVELRARR